MKAKWIFGLSAWMLAVLSSPAAQPYDFGNPSPEEEWMRFCINRARTDPEAEADRLGLDNTHGDDVPDGAYDVGEGITISGVADQRTYWSRYQGPRQYVAWSAALNAASRNHCDDMHTYSFFSHYTAGSSHGYPNGSGPDYRGYAEGYPNHFIGENISTNNSAGSYTAETVHNGLFTEPEVVGRGHRKNLLHSFWREIGAGRVSRPPNLSGWTDFWTTDFGSDAFYSQVVDPWPPIDTVYVTGTVFDDLDSDGAYQPGEQMPGVMVRVYDSGGAELQYYAVTADGGGYSVPLLTGAGADVPAGENVEVLIFDPAGQRYLRAVRTVQDGDVVFEDTAAEVPDTYHQRFNVGLDVEADQLAQAVGGDANLDGCADGLDYIIWSNNYQQSDRWWGEGDFDGGGYVDGLDYIIWSNNYLQGCPAAPGPVPEPTGLLLLTLAGLALIRRRRYKHHQS